MRTMMRIEAEQRRARCREAIRRAVCRVCPSFLSRGPDGACEREVSNTCTVFANFVHLVDAVSRQHSTSIEPYEREVRRRVCVRCANQDVLGDCEIREGLDPLPVWCPLDAYLNLVVGAIEEALEAA